MTELTITPESIKILDAQQLTNNHTLIITVDTQNMPRTKMEAYFNDILAQFKRALPGSTIIIVPKTLDIQIIKQE